MRIFKIQNLAEVRRTLTFKPQLPMKSMLWKNVQNNRIYCLLAMMQYLLSYINPDSTWGDRLKTLLTDHPQISLQVMGFPQDWRKSPLWDAGGAIIDNSSQQSTVRANKEKTVTT